MRSAPLSLAQLKGGGRLHHKPPRDAHDDGKGHGSGGLPRMAAAGVTWMAPSTGGDPFDCSRKDCLEASLASMSEGRIPKLTVVDANRNTTEEKHKQRNMATPPLRDALHRRTASAAGTHAAPSLPMHSVSATCW